jgi:lactose/L-arabinose transport system ATP-binding protein
VTHDQVEAMTLADRIVVLRNGIIEQQGAPTELYDNPDNMFVAGFIGSPRMNFLPGTVVAAGPNTAEVRLADFGAPTITVPTRSSATKPGDSVSVGIRPEHFVDAGGAALVLKARAAVVEQLGGISHVHAVGPGGEQVTVQQLGHSKMSTGTDVAFGVNAAACLLFSDAGARL